MTTVNPKLIKRMTPKLIGKTHFLSKETAKDSQTFKLDGSRINLELDLEKNIQVANVNDFKLTKAAERKLSRKSNIVESIASVIKPDSPSIDLIKKYMKKVKVDEYTIKHGNFYFITNRRRKNDLITRPSEDNSELLSLAKKVEIEAENSFILSMSANSKGQLVAAIILPDLIINRINHQMGITKFTFPSQEDNDGKKTIVESHPDPDDTNRRLDFAKCYKNCTDNIPLWLEAIVAGICAACITTIAAQLIPGAQPIATPILIAACVGCGLAVGAVLGNCLLTCHELLGQ